MKKNTCAICFSENTYSKKLKNFELLQCSYCHFAVLSPYPTAAETSKIYSSQYFDNKIQEDHLNDSFKKWKQVSRYLDLNKKCRLLDFGCGTGNFLTHAKEFCQVWGFDVSEFASDFVNSELGITCVSGQFKKEIFKPNFFDCIVCFDVIEHITDYEELFSAFEYWLKPGGFVFITTPNIDCWDAKVMGRFWYGYRKYPEHINFFTVKAIKVLASRHSLNIIHTKVWGFVRSFKFIFEKIEKVYNSSWSNFFYKVLQRLKLLDKEVYLPMVDVMVVLRKKR